ncbi:MAG: phenylalanine--tRNA ligase beta subunit-related protein [Pirellulales bacterium]
MHIAPHPLLDAVVVECELPRPLGELPSPESLLALLKLDAAAPLTSSDEVRQHVRDLLRQGGFKPTGRSKPASEYLLKAASDGTLQSINLAVDVCNAVSLHSGLPISVVDADRVRGALRIEIAPPGASYVFNLSGQTIELAGLVCLMDDEGPCANPVKDAQRTKTTPETRRVVAVIWGTKKLPDRAAAAARWFQKCLTDAASATG